MEPKVTISPTGEKTHYSVGAIIKNDAGKYLMIDRLKKPFGFACPAGHIDEGETSLLAILRETEEETGLKIASIKRIDTSDFTDIPNETCSRGVTNHIWKLYEIKATGKLIFKADEVKSIDWYTVEEIKELPLETAWKYFLTKLNII